MISLFPKSSYLTKMEDSLISNVSRRKQLKEKIIEINFFSCGKYIQANQNLSQFAEGGLGESDLVNHIEKSLE